MLPLIIFSLILHHLTTAQQFCNVNNDCPIGQQCVASDSGGRICQTSIGQGVQPNIASVSDPWITCYTDYDCIKYGAGRCISVNGRQRCSAFPNGGIGVPVGGVNSQCTRNSDCQNGLRCVNNNGVLRCQAITGGIIGNNGQPCRMDSDCFLPGQKCIFSYQTYSSVCQAPGDGGGGVISQQTPSPMAQQRSCYADYHCQLGETCTGQSYDLSAMRTCRMDPNAYNRQCIYHSDCLTGQLCLRNMSSIFVCTFTPLATGSRLTCQYDYECPGGDKCVNVAGGIGAGAASFRCRPATVQLGEFATHGQYCLTNADCPFQQVCQNTGIQNQCVDVDYLARKLDENTSIGFTYEPKRTSTSNSSTASVGK